MTDLEQLTLNAVAHISASKALKKEEPTIALMKEVFEMMKGYDKEQVRGALRSLTRAGRITYGNTINDIYFKCRKTNRSLACGM